MAATVFTAPVTRWEDQCEWTKSLMARSSMDVSPAASSADGMAARFLGVMVVCLSVIHARKLRL
jgi:hypothetical protein